MLCVAQNLGPGLRYDTLSGNISVRLSTDADNAASFGSDTGIYVPGEGTTPDPASGRKTVAGLPARPFGATQGGAGSMTPFGAPYAVEYGVANRMDIISFHTFVLADGIAISRWGTGPDGSLNTFTDNPSSIEAKLISSVQLGSLNVDAGTRVSPTGRNSGAPSSLLSPDGGWFGFYANEFTPITLAEGLHRLAARAVAYIATYGGLDATVIPDNIESGINAVIQAGSQEWTILGIPPYVDDGGGTNIISPSWPSWVGDVVGAGITPAADLFDDNEAGFLMTPQDVIDAGVEWVRFKVTEEDGGTSFTRVQEFIDAGLEVIVQTDSRQFTTQTAYNLGVRAVMADSPVYARGSRGETGDLDYRKTIVIPGLQTRTSMEGALTRETNDGFNAVTDAGWCRQSTPGRYFSEGFGREGGVGARITSQLLGEICPYEVTANHRIRVRFRVDPTQVTEPGGTNIPKLGLFVASPTDRDITTFDDGVPPELNPWVNGYWCHVRIGSVEQGQVTLGKVTDGFYEILQEDQSFPSITYGDWIFMSVELTTTNVILSVGHATLGTDIVYNVADATHRGPYAFYGWEDDFIAPVGNDGFAHGYAPYPDFATTDPMYEDLS